MREHLIRITRAECAHLIDEEGGEYLAEQSTATDAAATLRDIVMWMRGGEPSCWPARGEPYEWVTIDREVCGDVEHATSLHLAHDATPRERRLWRLAFRAAGLSRINPPAMTDHDMTRAERAFGA